MLYYYNCVSQRVNDYTDVCVLQTSYVHISSYIQYWCWNCLWNCCSSKRWRKE